MNKGSSEGFFAHTMPGAASERWQRLDDHLLNVGEIAARFAGAFGCAEWGRRCGRWHDLGKFSQAFQDYLHMSEDASCGRKVDHSTAGAQHAASSVEVFGSLISYIIAGHHGGLPDGRNENRSCLEQRLKKRVEPWSMENEDLLRAEIGDKIPRVLDDALSERSDFSVAMFARMLFSCLVDADFLDTERFMAPEKHEIRADWGENALSQMSLCLDRHMDRFASPDNEVDEQRAKVLYDCRRAAEKSPGLFSLTVPTGGGKTLSSLSFALLHAVRHGLDRVIYVIPFTSIIEQNADVFREVMKPLEKVWHESPVLEHHSNIDLEEQSTSSRLATENWDSPLIVTTSVQFYESLYANRPGRCRKLHNIARSVIILDEAQTLPVQYLEPCLAALEELTRSYGSSVVLCTATQPAVSRRDKFPKGLEGVREIVSDTRRLYRKLKRVDVYDIGTKTDSELAELMLDTDQTLCIVNTRGHAALLFEEIGDEDGHYHLSAQMTPEHRSNVLREIHSRLELGNVCRIVSTQLIEAGVDIDVPEVMRSLAGIDSIAQAAGRCNRNGRLAGRGRTMVFRSEHTRSERFFRETAECAAQVLAIQDDPLSINAVEKYFSLYYWSRSKFFDEKQILDEFNIDRGDRQFPFNFSFSKVAKLFHLIEDSGKPLIIPWREKGRRLCERLRETVEQPDRFLLRRLQRYTVTLPSHHWEEGFALGAIELVGDRFPVLVSPEMHYSEKTGVCLDDDSAGPLIT